jgi:hypothetical protein
MCKVEPMSSIAEPQPQPQNNPDPHGPSIPAQAPAPEVQTRISLAVTPGAPLTPTASRSTEIALDHDDQFPSQATVTQHHRQLQQDSEQFHHQLHHHVYGSTLVAASAPAQGQLSQEQNQLEAANIAHFDALGHDFDKQNPFSAEFADRLSRALRRLSPHRSAGSSNDVDSGYPLVLDEDSTSVLDYACGSGTCFLSPPFRVGMVFLIRNLIAIFVMLGQVSRALAPYVAQLVGVDISPRMVEVYNTRASTQGLEPHEMRAVSSLAELQQQRFDLAVVSHSLSP